jgi:hypothetical protein
MFSFILTFSASQSSDFSSSWEWWSVHIIFPAMLTVLTGAATFILLWYRLSKTEFYRRLSRGEPYGQELWTRQIELYVSVCKIAREAFEDVYSFVWHKKQNDQDNEEKIPECFNKLESIWAEVSILLRAYPKSHPERSEGSRLQSQITHFCHCFLLDSSLRSE